MEADATQSDMRGAVMRKLAFRLMPFLTLGYFVAGLDRVNVAFAALHMQEVPGLTPYVYGLGAGVFFVSYCAFAVPSNMMMVKLGARRWLGIVMVAWGLISALMATTSGPVSFVTLRFLLGVAEAGFFPGVLLLLTSWFPKSYRGRVVALFMVALPVSNFFGSPLSGALLSLDGFLGLAGWHWMFIIEALPAILMGLSIGLFLPSDIASARWLNNAQKDWISGQLAADRLGEDRLEKPSVWFVLRHTWAVPLALIYFGGTSVNNGVVLWQPQIIKTFGLTDMQVGLVTALPFAIGAICMISWGLSSDKRQERILHVALPLAAAAIALGCSTATGGLVGLVLILCVTIAGSYSFLGPFWALVSEKIPPASAAIAIGLVNSLNQLGNFGATWIICYVRSTTGDFRFALLPLIGFAALGFAMVLWVGLAGRRQDRLGKLLREPHADRATLQ